MKILLPIVGMNFRPPAGKVLAELPFGTKVLLQRQYDNQYDANAIKVLIPGFSSEGEHKELFARIWNDALPDEFPAGRGCWNQSFLTDPLWVGFVGAKTGHAGLLAPFMDQDNAEGPMEMIEARQFEGELNALPTGNPAVLIEVPDDVGFKFSGL